MTGAELCGCGATLEHRKFIDSQNHHWASEFCWSCGYESTSVIVGQDLADPISSSEVLAVHEALASNKWEELIA